MAPFPEDEIMTIKRLEVALRKSDFKLLKEGAYKLHEKYHSHHHFEYLDLLKEILDEVQSSYVVPPDVKDILIPTIQDILSGDDKYQSEEQNRVSTLTSLSYGLNNRQEQTHEPNISEAQPITFNFDEIKEEPKAQEEYIKPFQEFTPIKPIEMITNTSEAKNNSNENVVNNQEYKSIADSYNEIQNEDFDTEMPLIHQQNIFENKTEETSERNLYYTDEQNEQEKQQEENLKEIFEEPVENIKYDAEDEKEQTEFIEPKEEVEEKTVESYIQDSKEETFIEEQEPNETVQEEIEEETPEEKHDFIEQEEEIKIAQEEEYIPKQKTITVFFGQDSSIEKIKNIEKYRKLIQNGNDFSLSEIVFLINEIKTQADTNVSELQTFLEQLKTTNHNINILTNSQSANLIDLFNQSDITYSIFNSSDDKRVNLLALFGLTNLYKCIECDSEYLETNEKINSFILQCPKCKHAMLPDLYSSKTKINMDYYNASMIALADSDTWLLIHPSLSEKLIFNMIKSAIKLSSKVKEVYILDKDINIRETYKKLFEDTNPEIKIISGLNVTEDFLNNI